MVSESKASFSVRIRNVLSYLFLLLAALREAYAVLAIALDRFAPSWYRTLGRILFIVPFALVVGLLLFYANRVRLGFYLSVTSLSLYAVLICLDTFQGPTERGDWLFLGVWLAFCAIGIFATRSLYRSISVISKSQGLARIVVQRDLERGCAGAAKSNRRCFDPVSPRSI